MSDDGLGKNETDKEEVSKEKVHQEEHNQQNHNKRPIIVIKRIIKKQAHHGGSWKIAYADFVTAMMAFFLLMWLLSMLNKFQLMGISNYFRKPLKNVYVDNQKNDENVRKIPDEQTKKYKLVLNTKEVSPNDAHTMGEKGHNLEKFKHEGQPIVQVKQVQKHTMAGIRALKKQLEADLEKTEKTRKFKEHLTFTISKDGLKVNLHDLENNPMFSSGGIDFEAYAKPILGWLAQEMNQTNHKITIIGFTDTNPYVYGHEYSNWELSADRANATRRVLIKSGIQSGRIIRVQGAADSVLLNKQFGADPMNRRIEIILLTDEAAHNFLNQ